MTCIKKNQTVNAVKISYYCMSLLIKQLSQLCKNSKWQQKYWHFNSSTHLLRQCHQWWISHFFPFLGFIFMSRSRSSKLQRLPDTLEGRPTHPPIRPQYFIPHWSLLQEWNEKHKLSFAVFMLLVPVWSDVWGGEYTCTSFSFGLFR